MKHFKLISLIAILNLTGFVFGAEGGAAHNIDPELHQLRENTVTNLDLSFNQIEDTGATALAEALTQNTSLTNLYLSRNQIGDAGATALRILSRKDLFLYTRGGL